MYIIFSILLWCQKTCTYFESFYRTILSCVFYFDYVYLLIQSFPYSYFYFCPVEASASFAFLCTMVAAEHTLYDILIWTHVFKNNKKCIRWCLSGRWRCCLHSPRSGLMGQQTASRPATINTNNIHHLIHTSHTRILSRSLPTRCLRTLPSDKQILAFLQIFHN